MTRRFPTWTLAISAALVVAGCVSTPAETSTTGPAAVATALPNVGFAKNLDPAPTVTEQPSVSLNARPHGADMTEVVLAPDGRAALTLDTHGGVRLWAAFDDERPPWELPVEEPLWMSLAAHDAGFVVAFVDTAGAAHVGRVEVSDTGARWVTAFDVPPMDPVFEAHVLSGGDRILALGVDHRVRLWDLQGRTVSELDERGTVPWQLRVQHDADGKPHAAAVLFAPVRIQRLGVLGDTLELLGEAHPLAIDQSPNRNDIGMSPDGRYATAMQKPTAGKGRFELEVVNLHDGSRRMWVAESDTGFRPRIHPRQDEILAETGSGSALRLPLDGAVPWQLGGDRTALPVRPAARMSFAGSTADSLMHATMRGGVHALAWGRSLHLQRADKDNPTSDLHSDVVITHDTFHPTAVGLNPSGTRVAWANADAIVLESVAGDAPLRTLAPTQAPTNLLAFVGSDQLLAMDAKGRVELRDLETDMLLDTAHLPVAWEAVRTGWRPSPTGGHVILASSQPSAPLQVLSVEDGALGSVSEVDRSKRSRWPEGGKPPRMQSGAWMASLGHNLVSLDLKPTQVLATLPGPRESRVMVVQRGELTMIDEAKNERLWARSSGRVDDAAWSSDGRWFAFADNTGGHICDARSGEVVFERRTLPPTSARRPLPQP